MDSASLLSLTTFRMDPLKKQGHDMLALSKTPGGKCQINENLELVVHWKPTGLEHNIT